MPSFWRIITSPAARPIRPVRSLRRRTGTRGWYLPWHLESTPPPTEITPLQKPSFSGIPLPLPNQFSPLNFPLLINPGWGCKPCKFQPGILDCRTANDSEKKSRKKRLKNFQKNLKNFSVLTFPESPALCTPWHSQTG